MSKRKLMSSHNDSTEQQIIEQLQSMGFTLDKKSGHLAYSDKFKPIAINYELVLIRHGETYGNCGQATAESQIDKHAVSSGLKDSNKRIFQGDVDSDINQLTDEGKTQALTAAYHLENELLAKLWVPDVILCSPLKRAQETAHPFVQRNLLQNKFVCHNNVKEMSFGKWENRRVCDFLADDECHSFYKENNALVKADTDMKKAENFCDVVIRAEHVLQELNKKYQHKNIIIFTHSMFGAACSILLGKGKIHEAGYIVFDGEANDGKSNTLPHAKPIMFNFKSEKAAPVRIINFNRKK